MKTHAPVMAHKAALPLEQSVALHDALVTSEMFYSIQGEGASLGTPSVFLRLAGCNLRCAGFSYKHPITGEHLGCDTKHVWQQGKKLNFNTILQDWVHQGWLNRLNQGAHLIITGGEPVIQQLALIEFIKLIDQACLAPPFIELETNASLAINSQLLARLNQINASPKLTNSGESSEKAFNLTTLKQLAENNKTKFKFVVSTPTDIKEIMKNYITPLNLQSHNIWLMPEGGTIAEIQTKSLWLIELCKEYGFNYSPRLHILIWNEATGV